METKLNYCDSCHRNLGEIHVTLEVYVTRLTGTRSKFVQFWLCKECERKSQILLAKDAAQRNRVAQAITPTPGWWVVDPNMKVVADGR